MRIPGGNFQRFSILGVGFICILGWGFLATPSHGGTPSKAFISATLVHSVHAGPAGPSGLLPEQDAGQAAPAPSAAAPSAPKPVELPEGDGKPIAEQYCQECHRLTNLTKAHKDLDDWKDTIHTMIDRGADIPEDKIDTLATYLVKNFGPKDAAAPAANSQAAPSSTPTPAAPAATAPGAPEPVKAVVELPEGEGKAIATENCQACHKLTNLTKAHKNLDDWKDTVQTMIDRGANVPPDKVDVLVQYLAKNFGPKDASAPGSAPASPAAQ